jgi:hypothetical protein
LFFDYSIIPFSPGLFMDKATIIGIVLGIGAVIGGNRWKVGVSLDHAGDGGHHRFGGTFGLCFSVSLSQCDQRFQRH